LDILTDYRKIRSPAFGTAVQCKASSKQRYK